MHGGAATSVRGMMIPMFRLRIPPRIRRLAMSSVLFVLASGCATGFGPKAVRSERPDYNRQIIRSNDAELLLNLVRLRYNDGMLFLGVGGVVAQYAYDAALNAGGTAGGGNPAGATFGTAFDYGEKPTITYTPLVGEEAAARLLAPISIGSIMLFQQAGWSANRLLLLTVQRVNDVFNAPTAGGPTPARKPDFEAFADLAERSGAPARGRARRRQLDPEGARSRAVRTRPEETRNQGARTRAAFLDPPAGQSAEPARGRRRRGPPRPRSRARPR